MLYYLLYEQFFPYVSGFRVFRYNTFRTAFAGLTALFLCVVLGPWLIARLRQFQIGQHIREDGPKSHHSKAGTPTMGGVLILISIMVPTMLWADLRNPYVWIALMALFGFGLIGFIDDYAKITRRRNLGLTGRRKMAYQVTVSLIFAGLLMVMHAYGWYSTVMNVPFFKQFRPSLLIPDLLANPWTWILGAAPFLIFVAFVLEIGRASCRERV